MNTIQVNIKHLALLLLLFVGWAQTSMAQAEQFEMVVEKTDGTELAFLVTDEYPLLQYGYRGEDMPSVLEIRTGNGITEVPCNEIKKLYTREATVATITITVKSCTREYGEENPVFEYIVEGGELEGEPELTCDAVPESPAGEYVIRIAAGTVTNYNVEYVEGTLTITKSPLTVTAKSYTRKQGEPNPDFEVEYSGWKNGETEEVLLAPPVATTAAVESSEPGTYSITVSGGEAQNYELSYVDGILTVQEADKVYVTARSYTREYGEENPVFEYIVDGGELEGEPVISCEATATSPVGTYPITILAGSVTNYNVTYVAGTLTITKSPLTVTAKSYTRKQGEPNPDFEVEYRGWKNGETEEVLLAPPVATTTAVESSEPGIYSITVSGGEAENYEMSYVDGVLTVLEADKIVVTAHSYSREYGEENPVFEYIVEGGELEGEPELTCDAVPESPAGEYVIRIAAGTVTNYNVEYVEGTLTIVKAPLTVTAQDAVRAEGEENPEFELLYEGWKLDDDESMLAVLPIATTTATAESTAGTYPIIVSGGESDCYAFEYVDGVLTIEEGNGIATLLASGRPFDVYTPTGRKVRHQVTTLKDLPRGVYIVNGQKVIR